MIRLHKVLIWGPKQLTIREAQTWVDPLVITIDDADGLRTIVRLEVHSEEAARELAEAFKNFSVAFRGFK